MSGRRGEGQQEKQRLRPPSAETWSLRAGAQHVQCGRNGGRRPFSEGDLSEQHSKLQRGRKRTVPGGGRPGDLTPEEEPPGSSEAVMSVEDRWQGVGERRARSNLMPQQSACNCVYLLREDIWTVCLRAKGEAFRTQPGSAREIMRKPSLNYPARHRGRGKRLGLWIGGRGRRFEEVVPASALGCKQQKGTPAK